MCVLTNVSKWVKQNCLLPLTCDRQLTLEFFKWNWAEFYFGITTLTHPSQTMCIMFNYPDNQKNDRIIYWTYNQFYVTPRCYTPFSPINKFYATCSIYIWFVICTNPEIFIPMLSDEINEGLTFFVLRLQVLKVLSCKYVFGLMYNSLPYTKAINKYEDRLCWI
jgi:hypothetical protein